MITEVKIPNLNNKPPKFKGLVYPKPKDPNIQDCYYVCCAIGQRGTGKSYSVVKMLSNQEKSGFYDPISMKDVPIRHILFSPTFDVNPIFTLLKYLNEEDVFNEFSHEKLEEVLVQLKYEKDKTKEFEEYVKAYNKYNKMTPLQFLKWKDYKATLFKSVLNGRHYGINMFICAQNLKSINKAIRGNTEVWILFRFCSMKIILDVLYEEISALLTEEEFSELYQYATLEDHDAFVIDKKAEKGNVFKKNLNIVSQLC